MTIAGAATKLDPRSRNNVLQLKQPLVGHTEAVTCLCASSAYSVCVSGSRDRTCIMWDLSRLVFVRQLRGHFSPVAAVCINDLTVSTHERWRMGPKLQDNSVLILLGRF